MATFTPPTDNLVVWSERYESGIMARLRPGRRGRNIFRMTDGSYREDTPYDYWNIEKIYHGGHVHEINATEVAQLTAAGYGDYITL